MIALVAAFPVGVKHVPAVINKEPAGEEVDNIVASAFGDLDKFSIFCTAPGEVVMEPLVPIEFDTLLPVAFEPNLAQAFFHLH